ncbi:MAG: radical SAM protein [Magnetospirillum gryphiswaldense]|nr:radical SAM protein [Magnetospirillum gryphiswaldense]
MITQRIDNITLIPQHFHSATPPCPPSVKIELTARCDLACFFCATSQRLRDKRDMDWDFLMRLMGEMRHAGVEELGMFYLGESMLYPRLAEAIDAAKNRFGYPYVFLTTNGRLATPDRLRDCFEAGLDSLKFSFNWADASQAKEITRVDCFDDVVANILAARPIRDEVAARTGRRCGLYASSIQYDGEQRTRMEQAVQQILPAVDQHYWLPLYGQAGLTTGERGTMPVAGNVGRADAMRQSLPCWSLFTEGHVTWDGHLAACCFDHDGRFDMGDLNRQSFMEAWHSAPFQKLRQANLDKDVAGTQCEDCIAYRKHQG